ncbi:MFS transporter [Clostridium sp. HCS.1]|uniref:MFS transporter n=1 Tax=Clostridium sp. HCS.1 TaxID=3238594 RepID=UPI003A0FF19A
MRVKEKKLNLGLIMAVYLLGIFMGAIDTGIVTPARTIIQNDLMVNDNTGIWMITIYTLAYAASIPIMGKLADKYGRKYVYLTSISLFGIGSLFCGLSQNLGSFSVLLISRVVQAIGGGGILPIATAEFGTTFPKEKRGLALGLVGGVYGIANIFGASAGSAIIDIFGQNNWQFIFYINVPITIFILISGFMTLPNTKMTDVKKIDYFGITTLTLMVLSILYGLKNIDYFNFKNTFLSTSVYPFLIIFVVLLPIFILIEKKAEDPVLNISYFKNIRIIITFFIAFITGIIIMGMIFVPQFSENSLKIASGSGGYFVIILGVFAGIGAPFSGKLIDKYGAKIVLGTGFVASILGSLYIIFYATNNPSLISIVICLILLGTGIGFTMGTPINYMMLDNTKVEESNSALAAVSLIRSIGTAIAPAIMIGFISHAGMAVQDNIMTLIPNEVHVPKLPYAEELTEQLDQLKENPSMAEKLKGIDIPDLASMETIKFDMNSKSDNFQLPEEIIEMLQSSDVTTITDNTKKMAEYMFSQMTPSVIAKINGGIDSGITGISDSITQLTEAINKMPPIPTMKPTIDKMNAGKVQMEDTLVKMKALKEAVPTAFETGKNNYLTEIENIRGTIENEFQTTLNKGFQEVYATVAIASLLAMVVLMLYKEEKKVTTN